MSGAKEAPASLSSEKRGSDVESSDDDDGDNLQIVVSSPRRKKPLRIEPGEKEVIDSVESEIEDALTEKAFKSKLTTANVKHILKHVISNEHVLAMVRQSEDPDAAVEAVEYEPKLTRAKAKYVITMRRA